MSLTLCHSITLSALFLPINNFTPLQNKHETISIIYTNLNNNNENK